MSYNFNETAKSYILALRNEPLDFVENSISIDRYEIDGETEFRIQRCCGGPTVYFDTGYGLLLIYWGSDSYIYRATDDEIEAIRSIIEC